MMTRILILCISLMLLFNCQSAFAQCDRLIELSKEALADRNYELGIRRLLDANNAPECVNRRAEINELIQQAFAMVEGERKAADDRLVQIHQNMLKEFQDHIYQLEYQEAISVLPGSG